MKELNNQEDSRLKSRRNKTYKEGIDLYSSYLPRFSYNDLGIKKIFDILNNSFTFAFDTRVRLVKLNDHEL